MGPTPLTANYRLTFRYTVDGFQHKHRAYCEAVASADPTGFDISVRPGYTAPGLSTVHPRFFTVWAPYYKSTDTTFDDWLLEKRTGTTWVLQVSGSATVTPSGSTPRQKAAMMAVPGKNQNNGNLPAYMYEMAIGASQKFNSYAALDATAKAVVDYYFNQGGGATAVDAVAWRLSRNSFFSQRWLSLVTDSNEKLRRIRRIK